MFFVSVCLADFLFKSTRRLVSSAGKETDDLLRGGLLCCVRRENTEPGSAVGLAADRCIGEDQRRSRCNQRANALKKGRIDRDTVYQVLQVRRFSAYAGGGDPVAPADGINRRQSRIDIRSGYTSCLQPCDGHPPYLNAVPVDVDLAIRGAHDDRDRPFRRFFRRPHEAARCRRSCLSGKQQVGPDGMVRSGLVVGDMTVVPMPVTE